MRVRPFLTSMVVLTAIAGWASSAIAGSVPEGIKGVDDRHRVDSLAYPWSAIGRLSTGTDTRCTAVLIGPRLAVTAAHCLWDSLINDWTPRDRVFFSAGFRAGQRIGTSGIIAYDIASGYLGVADRRLENSAHDWAFLHLREPLGEEAGSIGLLNLSPALYERLAQTRLVILQAGYSLDQPYDMTAHIGCHLDGWAASGLLKHDCDATVGDSGSPIFTWVDGAFRLLGLHVSTFGRRGGGPADIWGGAVSAAEFHAPALVAGASTVGARGRAAPPSREVWAVLDALGYDPSGRGLAGAVTAFQADRNMTITGTPTPDVLGTALQSLR